MIPAKATQLIREPRRMLRRPRGPGVSYMNEAAYVRLGRRGRAGAGRSGMSWAVIGRSPPFVRPSRPPGRWSARSPCDESGAGEDQDGLRGDEVHLVDLGRQLHDA